MPADIKIDDFFKREALYIQNGFACGDWNDVGRGIIQLRPFNISENGEIDLSASKFVEVERDLQAYLLKTNDVIFNNTNSENLVGKTALWTKDQKAVLSNHMTIVRALKEDLLSPQFVAFYLLKKWMDGYFHQVCRRHVNQASVSIERLKDTPFPDFEISEQHQITHVLSTVQTAIEQQARLIALTRELKSTLMHKLFTEGLLGEKQKDTEIGLMPESWRTTKLGDLVNIRTGKLDSNAATPFGQYPFFTCSQQTARIDTFAFDTEAILLAGNNARGVYSVKHYKGKFNAYQRTYVLTQKDENQMPYSFLLYALATNLEHLRTVSIGTSTKYLTLGILQNLPIIKPDYDEAEEIGNAFALIDNKIELVKQKKRLLEEIFRTLLHQLMTGQTRVNEINLPGLS